MRKIGNSVTSQNEQRRFDDVVKDRLGRYIYALCDPRDNKAFYIGQGTGDRVFDHFKEAEASLKAGVFTSSKIRRIVDIWANEEPVRWYIIAYKLGDEIDKVESAVIDALGVSQNGPCLNANNGPGSTLLDPDAVKAFSAKLVDPVNSYQRVFIFHIRNALAENKDVYDATRGDWYVKESNQSVPAYAVGIVNNISRGAFHIDGWDPVVNKHRFSGKPHPSLEGLDWSQVIGKAKGYWQRGNYLVAEFDGAGRFRLLRGSGSEAPWYNTTL